MKVAVIGSRNVSVNTLRRYLPADTTEIVSGGARGVDNCAAQYARASGLKLTLFLPEYPKYGKRAPLYRNLQIIDYADCVFAFWDGNSHGTQFVIERCRKQGKPLYIFKSIC